MGLDASSREALLDLIYRLSREDKDGGDEGGGNGRAARGRGSGPVEGADEDDADADPERVRKDRVKEARRAEKELERKEKVLAKALKKDRRASAAEGANGRDDGDAKGWASSPHPPGSEVNVSVTSAQGGGETKVMKIKRAADIKEFLSAAKSKLKLKKKPLSARMVPSGREIHDTLRLEPMATVSVRADPPTERARERDDDDEEKSAPGTGDGDTGDDPTERLREAVARRLRDAERDVDRSRLPPGSDESARLLSLLSVERSDTAAATASRAHAQRAALPAAAVRAEIIAACVDSESPVSVVTGDTGSGKTTQAPQFVFERFVAAGDGARCGIVVCQPRRVAAVSIARRVAEERGERVGDVVGYQVRGESRTSARTRLTFCTTGVLLQRLRWDPSLEGITHVFVDEAHERTADADFLLILLRRLLRSGVAPELRVTLMSATVDAGRFIDYFAVRGEPTPRSTHIPGRAFPVDEVFVEEYLPSRRRGGAAARDRGGGERNGKNARNGDGYEIDYDLLRAAVDKACRDVQRDDRKPVGAVLVFLPGVPEISRAEQAVRDVRDARVVPLHGQLAPEDQRAAFAPAPPHKVKVVLATNAAETSVTIPDVTVVVDTGRVKRMTFETRAQLASLTEGWCSSASAAQRRGRAGRVRAGVCVRLYERWVPEKAMATHDEPELRTAPLDTLVMRALAIAPGEHPAAVLGEALDPPDAVAVRAAVERLRAIGAVVVERGDGGGDAAAAGNVTTTPLGFHLSLLPVEPRVGKMLVMGCVMGCLSPVLTAAAAMSCRPMFTARGGDRADAAAAKRRASRGSRSDHLACVNAFDEWIGSTNRRRTCADLNLSHAAMQDVARTRAQLRKRLEEAGFSPGAPAANARENNDDFVRCVLVAGLFPNVARVGVASGRTRVLNNRGVEVAVHPSGVNAAFRDDVDGDPRGSTTARRTFSGGPETGLLVYQEEVTTNKTFIRDTTAVPDASVLLFGGELGVDHASASVSVATGRSSAGGGGTASRFTFRGSPETGVLFKLLRKELETVLASAAEDPSGDHGTLEGSSRGRRVREVLETLFPGSGVSAR